MAGGAKITSREFNQDVSRAKRMAESGPVVITDRGRDRYVLLTSAEFERLSKPRRSLLDMLSCTDAEEIEFPPAVIGLRPAEFE